jgi:hypothetical protein
MSTIFDLFEVTSIAANTTYSTANGNLLGVVDGLSGTSLSDGEFDVGDMVQIGGVSYRIDVIREPASNGSFLLGDGTTRTFSPGSEANLSAVFLTISRQGEIRHFIIPNDSYGNLNVQSITIGAITNVGGSDAAIISTFNNDINIVCFTGGTLIEGEGGAQVPVEALAKGDLVMTADHGPRPIRMDRKAPDHGVGTGAAARTASGAHRGRGSGHPCAAKNHQPVAATSGSGAIPHRRAHVCRTRVTRDLHVLDQIDDLSIGFHPAIRHAHGQAAGLEGLGEIDGVAQKLAVGADHAGQLDLAHAQRIAAPLPAAPAQVETGQLPQPVKAKTAGHDRVAGKVAGKEPQVRVNVEFGHDMALAVFAAVSEISVMRSIISMGGSGSWALPGPNSSPRAHFRSRHLTQPLPLVRAPLSIGLRRLARPGPCHAAASGALLLKSRARAPYIAQQTGGRR